MAVGDKNYDLNLGNSTNRDYLDTNIYWGQVVVGPEKDPNGAGRCKVFVQALDGEIFNAGLNTNDTNGQPENYGQLIDSLPWATPLIPKFYSCYPKVGETVQLFLMEKTNSKIDRVYVGPVISQPQKFGDTNNLLGLMTGKFGLSTGLYGHAKAWFKVNGSRLGGENSPSNWSVYADDPKEPSNIALYGRGNQDIILRSSETYDEVLLRVSKYDKKNNSVVNLKNPGYISIVSYNATNIDSLSEDTTNINIVADNINLISHRGSKTKGKPSKGNGIILNSSEPEKQINLENINLHPTVYGDILWEVLKKLRVWVENHKHRGGGVAYTEPSKDTETVELLDSLDFALGGDPIQKTSPNGVTYKEYRGNLISNNIKIN